MSLSFLQRLELMLNVVGAVADAWLSLLLLFLHVRVILYFRLDWPLAAPNKLRDMNIRGDILTLAHA